MPSYDFSPLSPPDFESLVADLLDAQEGIRIERFGPGRDKGIDLRCGVDGTSIVQCKHYARSGPRSLIASLRKESSKWENVHDVDRYILVTSVRMTVGLKNEILKVLGEVVPISAGDVMGLEDLNGLLDKFPRIERQNFKLWINSATVLDRFINSEAWTRTEDLIESIGARAKFFVQTEKYAEALGVLDEKRVCTIIGPPGVGKSLLAEMLLLAHSFEGFDVVPLSADVSEGYAAWSPEAHQIFYYDDFLGQSNIVESLGRNQDDRLGNFIAKVERSDNKRMILTTRDQILRKAEMLSDRIRRASAISGRTVISIGDYSVYCKGQILYNHIYFSKLSPEGRAMLVEEDKYLDFIQHRNYSPRIIEQVIRRSSHDLETLYRDLSASLDNPQELWIASYSDLSSTAQKILRRLVAFPPTGVREVTMRSLIKPADVSAYTQALRVLEGTWIRLVSDNPQGAQILFANPSCRDFIIHELRSEDALADEAIAEADSVASLVLLYGYAQTLDSSDGAVLINSLKRSFDRMGRKLSDELLRKFAIECDRISEQDSDSATPFAYGMYADPRANMLTLLIPIVADVDPGGYQGLLTEQVNNLVDGPPLGRHVYINAQDILQLADVLYCGDSFSRALSRNLVEYSKEVIESWEELEGLRSLSKSLDIDLLAEDYRILAASILDNEIDHYLYDCSEADEISNAISDICAIAEDFGLDYSYKVNSLNERIDELQEPYDHMSGPRYRTPPAPSPEVPSDQAVRELFRGLLD